MTYDEWRLKKADLETKTASPQTAMVGKRTLVEQVNVSPIQRHATGAKADSAAVQDAASRGVRHHRHRYRTAPLSSSCSA